MRTEITLGQASGYLCFDLAMADKGYDSDNARKNMEERGVLTQIPMRKSRKMRVGIDHSPYFQRNLVERCFGKLKNARRVIARHDKTTEGFLGFIDTMSNAPKTGGSGLRPSQNYGDQRAPFAAGSDPMH